MKSPIPTLEADHQKTVIEWAAWNEKKYPPLKFLYACPNEGQHKVQYRAHQAKMGLKAGVPDLFLPYPTKTRQPRKEEPRIKGYHGLYIEMKTKSGSVKKKQKEWIEYLTEQGYKVEVCWSADEAIKILKEYLNWN